MRQIEITDNEILLLHRLLYRTREQANACKKHYGEKYESQADVDVELLEALLLKANGG